MEKNLIITGASEKYGDSLFALLGSLDCNWPNHPSVRIYDIGLSSEQVSFLVEKKYEIIKVPPFCEHWRKHYTWKIWCINDAPAENVLWIDSGVCILDNLDISFGEMGKKGYFLMPNYQFLDWEASEKACLACGVDYSFRIGKGTIAGTMMGFKKDGIIASILNKALSIALLEENIMAYNSRHKHDQMIISLLLYKDLQNITFSDGFIYLGWKSPNQVKEQKVWVHRRGMLPEDQKKFKSKIGAGNQKFLPKDPIKDINLIRKLFRILILRSKILIKGIISNNKITGVR